MNKNMTTILPFIFYKNNVVSRIYISQRTARGSIPPNSFEANECLQTFGSLVITVGIFILLFFIISLVFVVDRHT
jgi:hypothetical protein